MLHRGDGWEALGEVAFGAGRQARHALYVTLLEGIGGGIVEHERLLAGRDGSAGEIGHTRVSDDGPLCGCGARGCLEAHLAPARLGALWLGHSKQSRNSGSHNEDGRDDFSRMLDAARADDSAAQRILADAATSLARALGNAVSLLNPERIILGGRFVECGNLILAPLRESIAQFTLDEFAHGMDIRTAELSEPAFCGIAAEARKRLFAFPSIGAKLDLQDPESA
jgi:predicted NBD/HSP70 family sugar kinase